MFLSWLGPVMQWKSCHWKKLSESAARLYLAITKVLQTANSIVCCFPALANVCAFSACFKLACCFKFPSYFFSDFFKIFCHFIFKACIGKLGGSPRHCADLSCPSLPSYSGLQWEIPWLQTAMALGYTLMISLSIQMFTRLLHIKARVALFFLRLPELNETQTHVTWIWHWCHMTCVLFPHFPVSAISKWGRLCLYLLTWAFQPSTKLWVKVRLMLEEGIYPSSLHSPCPHQRAWWTLRSFLCSI